MKIDIILNEFCAPDEIAALGVLAERYGIHAIWTENYPAARDPFLALAPLAAKTNTIRMGPMAVSPIEMHPVKIANALFTLNELSEGRASILVGAGGGVMQVIGPRIERRVRAVRECIDIMMSASDNPAQRLTYQGEVYQVDGWYYPWSEDNAPLIYAGANGPKMLKMSTRKADGIMMSDMPLPLLPDVMAKLQDHLSEHNRSLNDFRVNNFWAWHIKEDAEDAQKEARRELFLRGYLQPLWLKPFLSAAEMQLVADKFENFRTAFRTRSHIIEDVPEEIIEKLIENLSFTGGLDALGPTLDRLKAFERAGLTEIALRLHEDQEEAIKLIGEEIMPAFPS